MKINIAQIFKNRPAQWGLRGDPFLWNDLEKHFSKYKTPYLEEDFLKEFYIMFEKFTGDSFNHNQNIVVKAYSHGGMSNGAICKEFWANTALLLLLKHLDQINSNYKHKK